MLIGVTEPKAYIPSEFQFVQTPAPQKQLITLTKYPSVDGSILIKAGNTAGTTLFTVPVLVADTIATAVTKIYNVIEAELKLADSAAVKYGVTKVTKVGTDALLL